jgi:hypothetical protein
MWGCSVGAAASGVGAGNGCAFRVRVRRQWLGMWGVGSGSHATDANRDPERVRSVFGRPHSVALSTPGVGIGLVCLDLRGIACCATRNLSLLRCFGHNEKPLLTGETLLPKRQTHGQAPGGTQTCRWRSGCRWGCRHCRPLHHKSLLGCTEPARYQTRWGLGVGG